MRTIGPRLRADAATGRLLPVSVLGILIRRALLIANPASRNGGRDLDAACRAIEAEQVSCDVVLTERSGHAMEIAVERARYYDAVFTLGGDGTAMEVAAALASTAIPLGVLPAGTGNLLARALFIPLNVRRAVPALLRGSVRNIDLGVAMHRHFAVAAGVGIDAAMVSETPPWLKRHLGVFAYVLVATRAALRIVVSRRFFTVRVDVDGEVIERQAATILFANFGAILDGRIAFGPGIECDDGLIDCCIFAPSNLADAIRIMWRLTQRDFRPDPALVYRRGRRFHLETTPRLPMQADGELLGMTPAEIHVAPRAAHMLVPRR